MLVVFFIGKVIIEEEMKEEMKEDVDFYNGVDDGKCGVCFIFFLRFGI